MRLGCREKAMTAHDRVTSKRQSEFQICRVAVTEEAANGMSPTKTAASLSCYLTI